MIFSAALQASGVNDIYTPNALSFTESNSAWYRVDVPKPCFLVAQDPATVIRFRARSDGTPAGSSYGTSKGGVAPLLASGVWWIQLPVTGTVAASRTLFLLDYAMYAGAPDALISGTPTAVTPAAPATVTVAQAASTAILAASSSRVRYSISNCDAANPIFVAYGGNAAVLNRGDRIGPGGALIVQPEDGFASLAIAGIAQTADVVVAVQAWS